MVFWRARVETQSASEGGYESQMIGMKRERNSMCDVYYMAMVLQKAWTIFMNRVLAMKPQSRGSARVHMIEAAL